MATTHSESLEELRRQFQATARQATRQGARALRLQVENLQAGLKKLSEGLRELEHPSGGKASEPASPRRTIRRAVRRRQQVRTSRPVRRKAQSKKAA